MGKITFIVGGARSGKSSYAIALAAKAKKAAFIATCEALDDEMAGRIKKHKQERPKHWVTFEVPLKVSAVIRKIPSGYDFILIDCLTLLVSNLLLKKLKAKQIEKEIVSILNALKKHKGASAIVSNEVGLGIVPDSKLGREFRDIAGRINKIVAERSARVVFMVAGMPLSIKKEGMDYE